MTLLSDLTLQNFLTKFMGYRIDTVAEFLTQNSRELKRISDDHKNTPLHYLCSTELPIQQFEQYLQILLQHWSINSKNKDQSTPLCTAIIYNLSKEHIRLLVTKIGNFLCHTQFLIQNIHRTKDWYTCSASVLYRDQI